MPLTTVPPGVVTLILPVEAPTGTVTPICVAEISLKLALTPLNSTEVTPVKLVPVMATRVPTVPPVGEKVMIVGAVITVLTVVVKVELAVLLPSPCDVAVMVAASLAPPAALVGICTVTVNVRLDPALIGPTLAGVTVVVNVVLPTEIVNESLAVPVLVKVSV
jgi:hypothetical protein